LIRAYPVFVAIVIVVAVVAVAKAMGDAGVGVC
jgi:hypothetical protein